MIIYPITPIPKPRMVKSDAWKKRPCVLRYWAFKDEIKRLNVKYENGSAVIFCRPMPKSWSKKKRAEMHGVRHLATPDNDNMLKALLDCIFDEDKHLWWYGPIVKIWANNGSITIIEPSKAWDLCAEIEATMALQ